MNTFIILRSILSVLIVLATSHAPIFCQISNNLDSLLLEEENMPNNTEKVKLLRDIGFNYSKTSTEKALSYYKKAIQLGSQLHEKKNTASSYSQIAILYNNIGDINNSDKYLEELKQLNEKSNDDNSWMAYYQAATLIYKKRKKLQDALFFAKRTVEYLQKQNNNESNLAGAFFNLANVYMELGQLKNAAQGYYKALSIFDKLNNKQGLSYCYNNIAILQKELNQIQSSIKNGEKALKLKRELNDLKGVAVSKQLLAENYYALKQYPKSLTYINTSINFFKSQDLLYELTACYQLKAQIFFRLKKNEEANKYYSLAIQLAKKLDASTLVQNLQKEKKKKLGLADDEKMYQQSLISLATAKRQHDTSAILTNLSFLSSYNYKIKRYKEAYDFQNEYNELNNIASGPEMVKQLKKIESNYQLSKKESTIKLLQKDKSLNQSKILQYQILVISVILLLLLLSLVTWLLANRNKLIQENKRKKELELMRNDIASDLHDEIGSLLSSIQIISSMAVDKYKKDSEMKQTASTISDLSNKVSNGIREIIWFINPEHDKLKDSITQLRRISTEILDVSEIPFVFTEEIDSPKYKLNPKQRKELIMIFKEAINNARKYSKSEKMMIHVAQKEKKLTIIVQDFGRGFDREKVILGNGLKNMERRALSISANLNITSSEEQGTEIILEIPLL